MDELATLRAQVEALEELNAAYEMTFLSQERRLRETLAQLEIKNRDLIAAEQAAARLAEERMEAERAKLILVEQESLRRATELERVNGEVQRLFQAVAHDLRAPLRAVETIASWLTEAVEKGDHGEMPRHLRTLRGRVERLDKMLVDLLSYARVGHAKRVLELVDVGALLAELTTDTVEIPDGFSVVWSGMPQLVTHRALLAQIFQNLIHNAIKHHDTGRGRIEVHAEDAGDRVVFRVCDDGPGIEPKYRDRIFRLFTTLKRRDLVEGSGIGLAIAQKSVVRLGGRIDVESCEGRGATFRFDVPKQTEG